MIDTLALDSTDRLVSVSIERIALVHESNIAALKKGQCEEAPAMACYWKQVGEANQCYVALASLRDSYATLASDCL